ncbi:MAG: hypothetical protein AAF494_14025 [Pseudomonadota bacterium]
MAVLQHLSVRIRLVVLLLLVAGLGIHALAPAGYMIAPSATGWLTVTICPETHPLAYQTRAASHDHSAMAPASPDHAAMGHAAMSHTPISHTQMDHGSDDGQGSASNQNTDCAFAGLIKLATGGIDPLLLSAALAFAVLIGLAPRVVFRLPQRGHVRPPLRGPPVLA